MANGSDSEDHPSSDCDETASERFRKNLKDYRLDNEYSQESLARECGLDRTYIGKIERGESIPSLPTVTQIARTLEVDIPAFFDCSD